MSAASRPFDDIRALIGQMPKADEAARAAAREREAELTKPAGSLGRLEEIAEWMAGWQASARPHVDNPLVAVFAGNHGVVAQGVSAYPASVTGAMVANFTAGGAAINQICKTFDISLKVYELALEQPTGDITREPALDEKACAATMAFGMEALASEPDLLVLGEMGIGNTTPAAAIYHALYGGEAEEWVGRGAGVDDNGPQAQGRRRGAAVARHEAHLGDPLEILRASRRARNRGDRRRDPRRAHAPHAGAARRFRGVLGGRGAAGARRSALDHCLAAHVSAERAHRRCFEVLGKTPLLDLGMRLGEGSGGALAVAVVKAAVACHNGMATFAEAEIAGKSGSSTGAVRNGRRAPRVVKPGANRVGGKNDRRRARDPRACRLVDRRQQGGRYPRLLALMTDDVIFMTPGRPPFGKAEFAADAESAKGITVDPRAEIQEWRLLGSRAFVRSRIEAVLTAPGELCPNACRDTP